MTHAPIGTICNCGERGWMPGVEHAPIQWAMKPVNRLTTMNPQVIVDHIMMGYGQTVVDWAVNGASKVIIHFAIFRVGRIVQMHPIFSPGIHASDYEYNDRMAPLVRKLSATLGSPNNYSIGIEHEGCSVDPWPSYRVPAGMIYSRSNPWPNPMVEASIRVHRWCFETAPSLGRPSRENVIGHYQTGDGDRINDPAAASDRSVWPIDRILAALTKGAAVPKSNSPTFPLPFVFRDMPVVGPPIAGAIPGLVSRKTEHVGTKEVSPGVLEHEFRFFTREKVK